MTRQGGQLPELAEAVRAAHAAVTRVTYPLPAPSAASARATADAIVHQLDDYVSPRVRNLDAPLLVVVGGSTGAGKSTLINSIVHAPVSRASVLRPTTRAPVLVCHPADAPWFRGEHLLQGLVDADAAPDGDRRLQIIAAPALPPGVALLDAPDIDSVVTENRDLALRLFAAADLWLFLTTATRYADAAAWEQLAAAKQRRAVVATVLARVRAAASGELVELLSGRLREHGMADVPVFVLPESQLDSQGLLPESSIAALRAWFDSLAADEPARASVVRGTLDGALAALGGQLNTLAAAADEQTAAAEELAEQVGVAYGAARRTIEEGLRSDPTTAWEPLVRSAAADAAERVEEVWRAHSVGQHLLGPEAGAGAPLLQELVSEELMAQVRKLAQESSGQAPDAKQRERLGRLLDDEAGRWLGRLGGVPFDGGPARWLRDAAEKLHRAREAARLTSPPDPASPTPSPGGPVPGSEAPR